MSTSTIPQYPEPLEIAGPSTWKTLHNLAANYPDHPSRTDKVQFKQTFSRLIEWFPFDECRNDAKRWIKQNPPRVNSRKELFDYVCELHNHVNQKLGKQVYSCDQMLGDKPSSKGSCTVQIPNNANPYDSQNNSNKDENPTVGSYDGSIKRAVSSVPVIPTTHSNINPTYINTPTLDESLQAYKNATLAIVSEFSKKEGIPVPEVIFNSCPGHLNQSCTHIPVSSDGSLVSVVPSKIFLDPNQASVRTIFHELQHVVAKYKGSTNWRNEEDIDRLAKAAVSKYFPFIEQKHNSVGNISNNVTVLDSTINNNNQPPPPQQQRQQTVQERVAARMASVKDTFPSYHSVLEHSSKTVKEAGPPTVGLGVSPMFPHILPSISFPGKSPEELQQKQMQEGQEIETVGGTQMSEGILATLDPVFEPFAKMLGVRTRHINEAHTPAILGNVIVTAAESNLNSFGSLLVSLVSSTITLAVGTLARDKLGLGDRKLLVQLGGDLLWNSMRYVGNPTYRKDVVNNAVKFGHSIAHFNIPTLTSSLAQTDISDKGGFGGTGIGPAGGFGFKDKLGPIGKIGDALSNRGDQGVPAPGRGGYGGGGGRVEKVVVEGGGRYKDVGPENRDFGGIQSVVDTRPGTPIGGRQIQIDSDIDEEEDGGLRRQISGISDDNDLTDDNAGAYYAGRSKNIPINAGY